MSDARHALFSAVYTVLAGDGGLATVVTGVFDRVPRGTEHPFVAFGDVASEPLDGDLPATVAHRFELFVHSRESGRREASDVAERVRALLDGAALSLAGHALVGLAHLSTDVRSSRDRRAFRARLRFRAITQSN